MYSWETNRLVGALFGALPAGFVASLGVYQDLWSGKLVEHLSIIVAIYLLAVLAGILNYRLFAYDIFEGEYVAINGDYPVLGWIFAVVVYVISALLTFLVFVWIINQTVETPLQNALLLMSMMTVLIGAVALLRVVLVYGIWILAYLIMLLFRRINFAN